MSLATAAVASADTYTVPAFTGSSIQATMNAASAAGSNNTVYLPAGTYTITSSITVPCGNGLTVTGPTTTPATAVLSATFNTSDIFNLYTCNGITIQYLQFANTGGLYFGSTDHSNITITHNQFTNLPSTSNGSGVSGGAVWLDGNLNTTVTNFTATYNTFGDPASCAAVFTNATDEGGNCVGIHAQPGVAINHTVEYNWFNHVEEGVHYTNLVGTSAARGSNQSVTQNLQIRYNYFLNWHRIAIEVQGGLINVGQQISDNVLAQPLNPSWGTMFISDACCTGGRTYLTSGPPTPANLTEDNLEWTDSPQKVGGFWSPVIGIEFWGGAGSRANNNFLMGNYSNQINWGFGVQPWYVENNYQCAAFAGEYITDEEGSVTPVIANNTQSATCSQQVSSAPTISPASGAYSGPQTVTLSNSGRNTSSYYTIDGSTPVPGSGTTQLYTGPFTVTAPATVKAVGMWGVPPQPTSYPAPYGFVPSAVATAIYTPSGSTGLASGVRLTGASIAAAGGGHSLSAGATMQMAAVCNYSDGSATNCNTTDAHGNAVKAWTSSNPAITVGATGLVTAASAGTANIAAAVGSFTTSPWTITVAPTAVTLSSVSLSNAGGAQSLLRGASVQMTAVCNYSDGSTTACNTTDSHGNAVSAWASSNTAAITVNAAGLASAVAAGSSNLTATVAGLTSPALAMTVTTPTLTSVSLSAASNSITVGGTGQLQATCTYSDGSTTNCTTTDVNGNQINPWTSSAPSVAMVSGGVATGLTPGTTNVTATIAPSNTAAKWGQTAYNTPGDTYPGYINANYIVLGNQSGGYSAQSCSFYLPAGTLTVGSQYDCGLIAAPTPTTQASSWQCWYTYTVTNSSSPGGWVTGALTNCGNLPAGSAWWVAVVTNQPGGSPAGFHNCGGACKGSTPATGSGTYPYRYVAAPYGQRTGMGTTMLPGGTNQASQYVTLGQPNLVSNSVALTVTPAVPKIASVYISAAGNETTLAPGGTLQFSAYAVYTDGTTHPLPDAQGNAVTSWRSSNPAVTIAGSGLATAASAGSATITATIGSFSAPGVALTVTAPPATLSSVSLSNATGAHSLLRGSSVQMSAICNYSDGTTTTCTTADSHGNGVTAWVSSATSAVTLSTSGLASAVAAGASNLTATVAGVTSTSWAMTVTTPTLTAVALAAATPSLTVGGTSQIQGTCTYSDGSTTNCTTTDVNGNQVNSWTSSAPAVATVSAAGVVTGLSTGATNITAMMTPTGETSQWGEPQYDLAGDTYPGFINAEYIVLGSQPGGYSAQSCSFYLPPGTLTVGSQYDCGLIEAPTPTTQATDWTCWYTYTVTSTTSPGGWVTGPLSNCGTLSSGSAWWVAVVTNQPGASPAGFYDCGGSCSGAEPATGTGTYPYRFIAAPYGQRSGMSTAMLSGGPKQAAQYVTLGPPSLVSNAVPLTVISATPTLTSAYLKSAGNATSLVKGSTLQFTAWGVYSDGSVHQLPDGQGNAVTLWNTSNHKIAKISSQGHVTALGTGTVTITALVGPLVAATPETLTVMAAPEPLPQKASSNAAEIPITLGASQGPMAPGAPVADPFAGPLWALSAPAGGSASISQGHLFLGVPGGSNHDVFSGQNDAVRVVQPMTDESFDVSIRIDTQLSPVDANTSQGLMVLADDRNYVTFALETDGVNIGLNAQTVTNGEAASVFKLAELPQYQSPFYLRLSREGSRFAAFYSADGENWIQATTFTSNLAPTAIGPFAANHNDVPANAVPVVMSVSSFNVR